MTAATNHRRSAHSEHQDPEQKQTTTSLSHRVPYNQLPDLLDAVQSSTFMTAKYSHRP